MWIFLTYSLPAYKCVLYQGQHNNKEEVVKVVDKLYSIQEGGEENYSLNLAVPTESLDKVLCEWNE